MIKPDRPALEMSPEVKATSFFMVPDWHEPEGDWRTLMLAYFRAFSPEDPVSLLLPFDPEQDSVENVQSLIAGVAAVAELSLELIPDTVLHPVTRDPMSWQTLASQCSAVLVASARQEEWLQGEKVPIIPDPTPAALRGWQVPRRSSDLSSYEDPEAYWKWRAEDLIHRYNNLDQWQEMRGYHQREAELVTALVRRFGIRDMLVAGCGNGRQFKYLLPEVEQLEGFDLVPEMVQDAQRAFPQLPVQCYGLEQLSLRARPHEAILSSTVLQHIKPSELPPILKALTQKAQRFLVFVELIRLEGQGVAAYNFAHDYPTLMRAHPEWRLVYHETHFQAPQVTSAVMAWERQDAAHQDDPMIARIRKMAPEQRQLVEAFLTLLALDDSKPALNE